MKKSEGIVYFESRDEIEDALNCVSSGRVVFVDIGGGDAERWPVIDVSELSPGAGTNSYLVARYSDDGVIYLRGETWTAFVEDKSNEFWMFDTEYDYESDYKG